MSAGQQIDLNSDETTGSSAMAQLRGMNRFWCRTLIASCALLALIAVAVPSAYASFEFEAAEVSINNANGKYTREAGSHPDFTFRFTTPSNNFIPKEAPRDIDLDLPPGLVGNPVPFPVCSLAEFESAQNSGFSTCSRESQVGTVDFTNGSTHIVVGLFNLEHGPDIPARFGFSWFQYHATITPRVRPGDYGISAGSFEISEALPVSSAVVKFWGTPASHVHDFERVLGNGNADVFPYAPLEDNAPKVPFFYTPTACDT